MLLKYSVKNYKSIKDKIELNMEAVGISEFAASVIVSKSGDKYLPLSIIYGPNGGGKSNILESLFCMRNKLLTPILNAISSDTMMEDDNVKIVPYVFNDENRLLPTEFEIIFSNLLGEYKYNISFNERVVLEEHLEMIKFSTNKKNFLFSRMDKEIKFGEEFLKFKIPVDMSKELPLLSFLGTYYNANNIVADILDWLLKKLIVSNYSNPRSMYNLYLKEDKKTKKMILDLLNEMDIDIKNYEIERIGANKYNIYTTHIVNGYEAKINYLAESNGSKKMLNLVPRIIDSLLNGTTLIIDELDANLHPLLLKHIIKLFTDKTSNKNNAQLIFTSHDMTTMTNELLRRDEIWFAAKGNKEDTQLYSLIEFKEGDISIRKDAKYNKQYLEGKYGADPYFKKIIDWQENE